MGEPAFAVTREGSDVVVRLRGDEFDQEALARLLDFIELEAIAQRSRLSEEAAAALADEVDRAVWERVKPLAGER